MSALSALNDGSYYLGGGGAKELSESVGLALWALASAKFFLRRGSMAGAVQSSSLAKATTVDLTSVVLEAESKPIKAM